MGSSCRSGKAAEEGEARTGTTGGHQSFLPHQLPRRRYSVPEVVIRKFRLATEEQWAPQTTPPIPFPHKGNPLPTRPLVAEELSRTKPWRAEESPRKVTYQNRGSQIGGRLTYFGEPGSERLEISRPTPPPPESPPRHVMSLIPRYSAIPRTDSMSVNLGGDGLLPLVTTQPLPPQPSPIPIAAIPVVSKGAESEDCSLVDSLEDEAVVLARRNQARAAKSALSATGGPPPEESPARTPKPQTPLVGGEAFFVAIGSSSPATSISFSGSSPSPCSSEKLKQPPERVKKASMSVGPETVSAMPKRLRDRLAQRHRRLVQKMERQRNQRKKAEEMATAKKTIPRPPRLRNLSKAPSETQSKPSQPLRRVPLGHTNRTNIPQPGGRAAKPHGTSGPTPSPKGGTPMRTRGGNFQQKFKCIPEDRSLHLGSSTSSTPPSSLSASSNSDEEEVEVDVVSVEAGPETDAARLRPRLISENAKKLGGRNRSRSGASRVPKPSKPHETEISELQTIKEESKGSMDTENEGKENGIKNQHAGDDTDEKLVNKENEEQVMAVPLNDSNNNMHYSVDLQGKRVDLVSQPGDSNIIIKVEQNGDAQLEGAAPQPALKSGSDEDSRSSKSSTKSSSKRGSLKRQKTNESSTLLTDQVSHKGKVALGIENNNEDDLVSLSCGWLNFYLMHADLKSSCEEDESRSLRKEEKATVRESRKEKELKPQKTVIRTSNHSRHAKVNPLDLSAPDPNGSGFPTKLPQIVSPQNSPTQETANLMSSTHPRSRLPRPLNPTRVQNTHNSLVPINSPSSAVSRPTQLSFFPNPSRIPSDSSQAPHSSSPTSPSTSHPNDRGRHRHHRRRRGRDVEWGAEASTGTQTGESSQGWSVTIAGSCPQPDVEMRLTFPTANGRSRCSGNRGRQHQSDSGLGEENNGMGRDRQGHAGGPTGQRQPSLLPSSIPLQEQHETWLLTLRNESTNAGGALEDGIGQRNSRLKPLKCLPEISYQPPSQDAGTKTRPNKCTTQ
ncbi:uncharacterized protein LOC124165702 isoform X2 [Ischnura elegans]|uniref:uncharacterized protein LOC124165702 isoform X2 n=1 Tax=Ischnura elegans TaxID=197161 RepID=UPI001ED88A3A|nr:uncharacterized protein LOC124165702 isoform X2 [Ischnura elegans]